MEKKRYLVVCYPGTAKVEKAFGIGHHVEASSKEEAIKIFIGTEHISQERIKEKDLKFSVEEVKD